jgi:hypothetical protein
MQGNNFGTGSTGVTGIGSDEVESYLGNSGKLFGRTTSTASSGPLLWVISNVTHTGGTVGNAISGILVNTTVTSPGTLNNYPYGISSSLKTNGAAPAQAVALVGGSTRSGTAGSGEIWGTNLSVTDTSGANSSAANGGALVGDETDVVASAADDAGNGVRVGKDIVLKNESGVGNAYFGFGSRVDGWNGATNVMAVWTESLPCLSDGFPNRVLFESLRDRHQGAGHADGNDGARLVDRAGSV